MPDQRISRRSLLAGAAGTSALLTLPKSVHAQGPAVKKGTSLRLWILKTYVEPTNKAIEASAQRWAQKHGASVTVEYFTFEDMQTKYVAAIENKSTPDVGQLGADRGERGGVEHIGNHEISLILVELHVGGREHGSESPCPKG